MKQETYDQVSKEIKAVLENEHDFTAQMATVSCLLHHAFPGRFVWCGFYVVDQTKERELVVGPYQGTIGCLRIPYDRGVCGAAAREEKTQLVEDVHAFPGHIACDGRTNSEIVVPVHNANKELIAVLDIDSENKSEFDDIDQQALEQLVQDIFIKPKGR